MTGSTPKDLDIDFTTHTSVLALPHTSSPATEAQTTITVNSAADIVVARQHGRRLSLECGSGSADATLVATIISELARNIVRYAKTGEVLLEKVRAGHKRGIKIVCRDAGPGINEAQRALVGGYSTSGGLGMGLSGVRRLVDEFYLDTGTNGTTVKLTKWLYDAVPAQSLMTSPLPAGMPHVALRASTTSRAPATTSL